MATRREVEDELLAIAGRLYDESPELFFVLVREAENTLRDQALRKTVTKQEKLLLTGG